MNISFARRVYPLGLVFCALALLGQGCQFFNRDLESDVDRAFPPSTSSGGGGELGGAARTPAAPKPLDIDSVADFKIAIDLVPDQSTCEKLPEMRKEEAQQHAELMSAQVSDLSFNFAAVAESTKSCASDEIILPTGSCADEWSRVQRAYHAAFLDTLFGKRNEASDKEYADAKAAWDACQKKLYGDQSSCVDTRKQTVAQAQGTYSLNVQQIEETHEQNLAKFDQLEAKCFNPLLISGQLRLPADVTVGGTVPTTPLAPSPSADVKSYGKYYVVTSTDPAKDTGNEVCASVGKTCVGYTALTVDVCKHFHPGAMPTFGIDGSKAGFYCDGAPQGGVCGKLANTCAICEACNVNADCAMEIGVLYREMYVECK